MLEPGARHGTANRVGEQLGASVAWTDREPGPQGCRRLLPQRQNAFPPSLAHDMDAGASLAVKMIQAKTDQLRHAQTGCKGQVQHCLVPDTELRARVWGVEQGLHLFMRQIADQRLVGLLHRNRMDAPRLVKARRQPILQEAEERVDARQSDVAGPGRVVTFDLDVLQEGQYQWRVDLFDVQLARFDFELARREADQELEAVSVRCAGVRACLALMREMLAQERGEMGSERGHDARPRCNASPASAICPI